jgi:ribosomal protein L18E
MQLVSRYLVKNNITVIANDAGFITEYRPVYNRQIQLYRGIENKLDFRILNADQKPVDISNYTVHLKMFDENKTLIVDVPGTILDDGSTVTRGMIVVTISASDLLSIKDQYVTYTLLVQDETNGTRLTYSDTNFGAAGIAKVRSDAMPGVMPARSISSFFAGNDDWVSNAFDAEPAKNGNTALHTAALYLDGYVGKIIVECSLNNALDGNESWSNVAEIDCDGTETDPVPLNYFGVFNYTRFKTSANPTDTITKILVRN